MSERFDLKIQDGVQTHKCKKGKSYWACVQEGNV